MSTGVIRFCLLKKKRDKKGGILHYVLMVEQTEKNKTGTVAEPTFGIQMAEFTMMVTEASVNEDRGMSQTTEVAFKKLAAGQVK
ncbi:hypothetical protein V6N13_026894 [Hibiscus sabdariffa]